VPIIRRQCPARMNAYLRKVCIVKYQSKTIYWWCFTFGPHASRNSASRIPNLCARRRLDNASIEMFRSDNSLNPSFWRSTPWSNSGLNGHVWVFGENPAFRKHDRIVNDVAVCSSARTRFQIYPWIDKGLAHWQQGPSQMDSKSFDVISNWNWNEYWNSWIRMFFIL
jgi:hypothetical protein